MKWHEMESRDGGAEGAGAYIMYNILHLHGCISITLTVPKYTSCCKEPCIPHVRCHRALCEVGIGLKIKEILAHKRIIILISWFVHFALFAKK